MWVGRQSQRNFPESRTRTVREENRSENVRKLKDRSNRYEIDRMKRNKSSRKIPRTEEHKLPS